MNTTETTKTITIDPPIEHNGGKLMSLQLREPTAAEVARSESKASAGITPEAARKRDLELVSWVSGVPGDALLKLRISQFNEAVRFVRQFLNEPTPAEDIADQQDELTIALDTQITAGNMTFTELKLHEPTTNDMSIADKEFASGMNAETLRRFQIVLTSQCSGAPRTIIERLPIRKLDQASRYLMGFTNAGQGTGVT